MPKNPHAFLDVAIGDRAGGRIVFELFVDITPRTVENFLALCRGDQGASRTSRNPLSYKGCKFFRVIPGFVIQSGDFDKNTGDGGESVFGGHFRDESFARRHTQAGVLSMANKGRHTNGSQFFVTLKKSPQLDGRHVAFGQVVSGMDVVRAIEKVPTDSTDKPRISVMIVGCGQLAAGGHSAFRSSRTCTPVEQMRADIEALAKNAGMSMEKANERPAILDVTSLPHLEEVPAVEETEQQEQVGAEINEPAIPPEEPEFQTEQQRRLYELKLKLNQGRRLNNKEVKAEVKRVQDPSYESRYAAGRERQEKKGKLEPKDGEEDDDESVPLAPKGREYLMETASLVERNEKANSKKKQGANFGWNVFNQDSLYRAHKKRLSESVHNKVAYEQQKKQMGSDFFNPNNVLVCAPYEPSEEAKAKLAEATEKAMNKRSTFSRRRMFVEDEDVSYINERNRHFNKKLERSFGAYSLEIKQNLERGTAL